MGTTEVPRRLIYDTEEGAREYRATGGVPRGFVQEPILWNVMYDAVLRLRLPSGVSSVGLTDDLDVLVVANYLEEVQLIANQRSSESGWTRSAQRWS